MYMKFIYIKRELNAVQYISSLLGFIYIPYYIHYAKRIILFGWMKSHTENIYSESESLLKFLDIYSESPGYSRTAYSRSSLPIPTT